MPPKKEPKHAASARRLATLNLSGPELAELTGVDESTGYRWLAGGSAPYKKYLKLLSDATGVNLLWLQKGEGARGGKAVLPDHPADRPTDSITAFREQMGREADEYYAEHPDEAAADTGLAVIARHASYTVFGADGEVEFRVSYLIEAKPGVEVGAIGAVS